MYDGETNSSHYFSACASTVLSFNECITYRFTPSFGHARFVRLGLNLGNSRLLCIEGCYWRIVIHLHASALLLRAVGHGENPASLGVGRRQPQPEEVSSWRRGRIVCSVSVKEKQCWRRSFWKLTLVRCPGMQQMRVAHELDVAHLEDHVQRQPLARLLKDGQGANLLLAQGWHQPLVGEARQAADVVRIPLAVYTGGRAQPVGPLAVAEVFKVEDGLPRPLILAVGDLALAVKVPDGLGQELGDVWVLALERVPHAVHADKVALAALGGSLDAEEADDIAVVGVEELPGGGAVDADLVDLGRVVPDILYVAEDVAPAVLAEEVAQVGAEAHVADRGLVEAPGAGGEALEEDEALSVEEVRSEDGQPFTQVREGEVFLYVADRLSSRPNPARGLAEMRGKHPV